MNMIKLTFTVYVYAHTELSKAISWNLRVSLEEKGGENMTRGATKVDAEQGEDTGLGEGKIMALSGHRQTL